MSHKTLPTFIVLVTLGIVGLTLNTLDTSSAEKEKAESIAEISTKPAIIALATTMGNFREALSSELLAAASFPLGDVEFYSWSNFPASRGNRGGIRFSELSAAQMTLFYEVLNAFLSDDGYTKVSLITKDVETHLNGINPRMWSTDYYHIALFGNPETDGSWGFQLDGHHLAINFLVHGDEVSIVPAFIGSEPATVNGIAVLGDERKLAFALLESLDASQKEKTIQTGSRGIQLGAGRGGTDSYQNYDYSDFVGVGLKASEMNDTQKENLRNLMKTYVYNLETKFADVWMADVDAGLDDTYFVWIGGTTPNDAVYYRVFNPAVWIEYNNEGGVGTGRGRGGRGGRDRGPRTGRDDGGPRGAQEDGSRGGNLDHIHTITRAPNGKDYGIFALNHGPKTLLEHYAFEDHHRINGKLFDYSIANVQDTKTRIH